MLTIERLIIHKVDHRTAQSAELSDLESPLSEAVVDFVRGHITSNLEHKNGRNAHFAAESTFAAQADRLWRNGEAFIPASREMARLLFAAVSGDKRISPSDLFVCAYREGEEGASRLALLKMEPQASFVGDFERLDGQRRIVLQPVDNVLPTTELQKSAFVFSPAERQARGYDLRVVDQQIARYGARRPVASFFTKQFLGCRVRLNEADLSQRFVYASSEWLRGMEEVWTPQQTAVFKQQVRASLLDARVDVEAFARRAIEDPAQQEAYLAYMVEHGMDQLTFAPDPVVRRRWAERLTFSGDDGLELRVDADAVGPGRTVEPRYDPATGLWTVVITTGTWREEGP